MSLMVQCVCALMSMSPGDGTKSDAACPDHAAAARTFPISPKDAKGQQLKELDVKLRASNAPFLGEGEIEETRATLARLPVGGAPMQRVNLKSRLAEAYLNVGRIDEAIQEYESNLELMRTIPNLTIDDRLTTMMRRLAIAYLRLGERQNCVAHHNADSCIFPLSTAAVHVEPAGAQRAATILARILEATPSDLESAWLLNVVHMQLGDYPQGVPTAFRIPTTALASEYDIKRFPDIAPKLGLNSFKRAGGSVVDDFDNDGFKDVIISSLDLGQCMRYFHNNGDGTFTERSEQSGLTGQTGSLNFSHGDYDGDGLLDLFAARGAWMANFGDIPVSLLKQMPDGTFRDVTIEAGVDCSGPCQVALFGDVDNDGNLDLFVGFETVQRTTGPAFPSKLFRNRGNGTFEDVTDKAGVANLKVCKGAAFGDYDEDGFLDLYISNMGAANRLYHNNRDGTFTDVASKLGVEDPIGSFATWFFDYNNDGHLDLLVTNYHSLERGAQVAAYYKNGATGIDHTRLYENDGKGGFKDVSIERGLNRTFYPMGCNFGDLDNDGYPDIYFGTGDPDFAHLWPNIMFRNDRGLRFQDVTTSGGFGHLQKGHGVSFADIDNDGDQDVFLNCGGALKDDQFWDVLFENPGHGNHWLAVALKGVKSNRSGVGARIRAHIVEPTGERDVYAYVGCNSSFGGKSYKQEMGLGKATSIKSLEVYWPVTGVTQKFANVPLDQFIRIEEGASAFQVVPHKAIRF